MRRWMWLILAIPIGFLGTASAQLNFQCAVNLDDSLGPDGNTYAIGDEIEFVLTVGVNLGDCHRRGHLLLPASDRRLSCQPLRRSDRRDPDRA